MSQCCDTSWAALAADAFTASALLRCKLLGGLGWCRSVVTLPGQPRRLLHFNVDCYTHPRIQYTASAKWRPSMEVLDRDDG